MCELLTGVGREKRAFQAPLLCVGVAPSADSSFSILLYSILLASRTPMRRG